MLRIYNTLTRAKEGVPSHRARTCAYVRVRNDRLRLLPPSATHECSWRSTWSPAICAAWAIGSPTCATSPDIDDKIIARADENGEDFRALTQRFTECMHEDCRAARGAGAGCRTEGDALHRSRLSRWWAD